MLKGVRDQVGYGKMLLTESNSEPFMRDINMFLTLVGFLSGDLPPIQPGSGSGSVIVPAFQSVYVQPALCTRRSECAKQKTIS